MNTCSACGAVNNADSKFCYACGSPMATADSVSPTPPVPPIPTEQPTPQPVQQASVYTPPTTPGVSHTYPNPYQHEAQAAVPSYGYATYTEPAKSGKSKWLLLLSLLTGVVAVITLLFSLTSLGSSVMGMFGLGKGAQFEWYYNEFHAPIFKTELAYVEDLNASLFENNYPDFDAIYVKAKTWKNGFEQLGKRYASNAKVAEYLIEANDYAISRNYRMVEAMDALIWAIEVDDADIYTNQFLPKIYEYNSLHEQWLVEMQKYADKYGYEIMN